MRNDNWRSAYSKAIDAVRYSDFEWGNNDCLFGLVVPVLQAITDRKKWFQSFKGRYTTERGALMVMRRSGFENMADLAASELVEIHKSRCLVGDIVAVPTDDAFGYSLGVCNGERAFALRPDGLGHVDMSKVQRAFEVR